MPILNELFGTWIGILSLLTIVFVLGIGIFIFFYVLRRMK
ncbi:MAG: DUF3149 domain-containing protein [Sulfuricaulis sp.]|nr:DUF3149 domain-containing protein [Sulfuricaulis sp.]